MTNFFLKNDNKLYDNVSLYRKEYCSCLYLGSQRLFPGSHG